MCYQLIKLTLCAYKQAKIKKPTFPNAKTRMGCELFQSERVPETKFEKHCLKAFFTMIKANYVTKNELFL